MWANSWIGHRKHLRNISRNLRNQNVINIYYNYYIQHMMTKSWPHKWPEGDSWRRHHKHKHTCHPPLVSVRCSSLTYGKKLFIQPGRIDATYLCHQVFSLEVSRIQPPVTNKKKRCRFM